MNNKKGSFLRGPEEVAGGLYLGGDLPFGNVLNLSILVETTPEAIKKYLPAPLKPLDDPYIIFTAMQVGYHVFNGKKCDGFLETGLYLPAEIDGDRGLFCLGLHLNSDMAIFWGKDVWGYPKKLAKIKIYYDGEEDFVLWEERRGIPFYSAFAKLDGKPNEPDFEEKFEKVSAFAPKHPGCGVNLTVKWANGKHDTGKPGNLFIHKPFIVVEYDKVLKELAPGKIGSVDLKLLWSDDDPWAEMPIKRVLGCSLDNYDYVMYGDYKCVEITDEKTIEKMAFYGYDYGSGHSIDF